MNNIKILNKHILRIGDKLNRKVLPFDRPVEVMEVLENSCALISNKEMWWVTYEGLKQFDFYIVE